MFYLDLNLIVVPSFNSSLFPVFHSRVELPESNYKQYQCQDSSTQRSLFFCFSDLYQVTEKNREMNDLDFHYRQKLFKLIVKL